MADLTVQQAEAHNAIGIQLRSAGKLAEALEAFQLARAIRPDNLEYLYNAASTLRAIGHTPEAIEALKLMIARAPMIPVAHYEMGRAVEGLGQVAEAINFYRRAVELDAKFLPAMHHLGMALSFKGRFDEAIAILQRAAELMPANPMIQVTLAHALHQMRRLQPAIEAYSRAIQLRPTDPDAHLGLGNVLVDAEMHDEAIASYQRAIAAGPGSARGYGNLARELMYVGRVDDALPLHRRAISLAPDDAHYHTNLAYAMHMSDLVDADELLEEHLRLAGRFAEPLAAKIPLHRNDHSSQRQIRVGYVSPNLHEHPVSTFLLPILEVHDRGQFHETCYCNSWVDDGMTARLRGAVDAWRTTPDLSDEKLAALIVEDQIDILVDLAQYTGGNRFLLFAQTRPGAGDLPRISWNDRIEDLRRPAERSVYRSLRLRSGRAARPDRAILHRANRASARNLLVLSADRECAARATLAGDRPRLCHVRLSEQTRQVVAVGNARMGGDFEKAFRNRVLLLQAPPGPIGRESWIFSARKASSNT